jgi:tryptophan 2,3-dioxygenase
MHTPTTVEAPTGCPFAHGAAVGRPPAMTTDPADDRHVVDAVDAWCAEPDADGLALARIVAEHIRTVGKHFVSRSLLARLARIRREHGAYHRYLDAFLHCVLDKYEDRYYNATYIALPLLDEILGDPEAGLDAERLSRLIVQDVVRRETSAQAAGAPDDWPDARTAKTRINHAARSVAACAGADPTDGLRGRARAWFELTVLPVHTAHDEYFFIRALQAHEMVYRVMTSHLRSATTALRSGSPEDAVEHLDRVNTVFVRAAGLFRLVATMRVEHFHAFRDYTQGASAIQSEAYKRFELACGRPTDERLASDAFTNVPHVRAEADANPDDISRAYLDARRDGAFSAPEWDAIDARLEQLEEAHQRWKTTHHSLAARMLGEATGSGYTAGVPYLKACVSNRLFFRLGDQLPGSRTS